MLGYPCVCCTDVVVLTSAAAGLVKPRSSWEAVSAETNGLFQSGTLEPEPLELDVVGIPGQV